MVVGVCTVHLALPGIRSLKDKRRIIKSVLERARRQFQVAAAEVDRQDSHRHAVLAFACVSNEGRHADSVLQSVVNWLDREDTIIIEEVSMEHR